MDWKLNRIHYPVYNLGRGKRIGIWVQGCTLACKGCISRSLWKTSGGKNVSVETLVQEIEKIYSGFSGITITGGEPFQQYPALISFCAYLKERTGSEIYVFTGYTLKELFDLFPDKLFMKYIDYLMDGRYVAGIHEDRNLRGSANQKLYLLKNAKAIPQKQYFQSDKFGLHISGNQTIFLSGIPRKNDMNNLKKYLKHSGIIIKSV